MDSLVLKQILIGKRYQTKGNSQSCSSQKMLSILWSLLINSRTGDINNREVLLGLHLANWPQRYKKWVAMI
jgi:hypothetical protein